ncbi:MAG: hypothetical protein GY788_25065 [bacterium]|nr:hypothetical protein [bacterium]
MNERQLLLAALWIALMFVYLLGDVIRIFAGDFTAGEIMGKEVGQGLWLAITAFMTIPIAMIILTLIFDGNGIRWANIVVAAGLLLFNLAGLPAYPGAYDKFLIVVGLVINGLTISYAWTWVQVLDQA